MLMNRFVVFLVLTTMLLYGKTIGKHKMCTSAVLNKGAQGQTKYEIKHICCLNYYLVNGTCQVCPSGRYGKLCSQKCNCEDNKRCDPVEGCICISEANCIGSSDWPVISLLQDTANFSSSSSSDWPVISLLQDTENFSSSILHDQFPILGISIVLCCSIFSVTMLMITTSSLVLKWYLG